MQQPARDAGAPEWSVYADALQEANDPRGELIALALAVAGGMAPTERDAYVARHRDALLGTAARHFEDLGLTWHMCSLDRIELRLRDAAIAPRVIVEVLGSPAAAELRELVVVGCAPPGGTLDLVPALATLAGSLPRTCMTLALVDDRARAAKLLSSGGFDPPDNLVRFGSLARFWPLLERFTIEVADAEQLDLGREIDAPKLVAFTLRCLRLVEADGDDAPIVARLAAARWPKLRELELRLPEEFVANIVDDRDGYIPTYFGDAALTDRYDEADRGENHRGMNWSLLQPLLENLRTCPLERLALTSFDTTGSLLETLEAAGLPPVLAELDLSDSSIADITWFIRHAALLHSVRRIVLERTPLSEASAQQLATTLGIQVAHSAGSGATFRYVVGQE